MQEPNPCLSCGACCATFRVSFYWGETDSNPDGIVPSELTSRISPFRVAMHGTDQPNPRCVALAGEIGCAVSCRIYSNRSSACREFSASWEHGVIEPDCDRARIRHGLQPLAPPLPPVFVEQPVTAPPVFMELAEVTVPAPLQVRL